jgi:hypothetical protein
MPVLRYSAMATAIWQPCFRYYYMERRREGISWYDRRTRGRVGGRKEFLVLFS